MLNTKVGSFFHGLIRHERIVFGAFLLFSGLLSVYLGQDINWDLRNYHFYNAYSFLNHRLDIDIAPGQLQTYLNPVMDIPAYFLITSLPPIVTGFIWGAMHGINLILVFRISQFIIRRFSFPETPTFVLACLIAILSFFGAANIGQLGGFMGDSTVAIVELLAIWFFLRDVDSEQPAKSRNLLLSGLCIGIAMGMKLTAAPFLVGLGVCFLIFKKTWHVKLRSVTWFGAMAFLGLMVTAGYWMLILGLKFRNPVFPYYNAIFKSSYIRPTNVSFPWLKPQNLIEFIVWPVSFLTPHPETGALRDGRLSLLFLAVIAFVVIKGYQACFTTHTEHASVGPASTPLTSTWRNPTVALLAIYFVTYFVWEIEFGAYRYLGALEFLSILVTVTLFWLLIPNWRHGAVILAGMFVVLLPSTIPASLVRVPWSQDFFDVHLPAEVNLTNTQILVTSNDPIGYVFAFFPQSSQIIRLQSNMDSFFLAPDGTPVFSILIKQTLAQNKAKYVMYPDGAESTVDTILQPYNFRTDFNRCYIIDTKMERLHLCGVRPRFLTGSLALRVKATQG